MGEIAFEMQPITRSFISGNGLMEENSLYNGYDLDIEPDDIEVADTVKVVWKKQYNLKRQYLS